MINIRNGYQLKIRPAVPDDAEEILKYVNQVAGESDNITFGPGEFEKTVEEERKFLENVNSSANNIMIIGTIDGEIAALANIGSSSRPRLQHCGELGITVKKRYWHLGVGTAMLNYLLKWAKEGKTIRKINLEVREDNFNAIKLYSKLGFVIEGRKTRTFYLKGQFYATLCMGLCFD